MTRTAAWTFGIAVAALAIGDWFVTAAPAGDPAGATPELKMGDAAVRAESREVEKDGAKESRLFVMLAGRGKGTVKLRMQETVLRFESRVPPMPVTRWSRDVELSSDAVKEIDLGATFTGKGPLATHWSLEVSLDGKEWVSLASGTAGLKSLPQIEESGK